MAIHNTPVGNVITSVSHSSPVRSFDSRYIVIFYLVFALPEKHPCHQKSVKKF